MRRPNILAVATLLLLPVLGAAQDDTATAPPPTTASVPPSSTATVSSATESSLPPASTRPGTSAAGSGASSRTGTVDRPPLSTGLGGDDDLVNDPPDVLLQIPELGVKKIELDVDNLDVELSLSAEVASLVSINAGVQASVEKVNITIADVNAAVDLRIRLGRLVEVVNRTLASLDLNPALIQLLDTVGDVGVGVVGAVDQILGSILSPNGSRINLLLDNLGNILSEVVDGTGKLVTTIVGDYATNMTEVAGSALTLAGGNTQRTFSYGPLGSLVDIIFDSLGRVVQATVQKKGAGGTASGNGGSSAGSSAPSSAATSSVKPSSTVGPAIRRSTTTTAAAARM